MNRRNFFRNVSLCFGAMVFTPQLVKPNWHDTLRYGRGIQPLVYGNEYGNILFYWDRTQCQWIVHEKGIPPNLNPVDFRQFESIRKEFSRYSITHIEDLPDGFSVNYASKLTPKWSQCPSPNPL